jgi:hypothetical protein
MGIIAREMERYRVTVNCIAAHAVTHMTETLFAGSGDAIKGLCPEHASSLVAYLAIDEAAHISGQGFQLIKGWHGVATVENSGGWRAADVRARVPELFREASFRLEPLG